MDKSATLQHIAKWSIDDRIDLVQEVWEGIVESGWQPQLSADQQAELHRRLCEIDADPENVVTRTDFERHVDRNQ